MRHITSCGGAFVLCCGFGTITVKCETLLFFIVLCNLLLCYNNLIIIVAKKKNDNDEDMVEIYMT